METLYTVLAIVACVLLFSFAIFIHEFGHFLAARWRGLRVEAFSIGFGPVLWKKSINGVEWRISAIPFGGYVAIPDVDPEGTAKVQGSEGKQDEPAGKTATPLDSIIVAVAGPLGNVVLAVVLAVLLAAVPGVKFGEIPALIGEIPAEGPAYEAGMKAGDKVVSVGGVPVRTWIEMQTEVQISGVEASGATYLNHASQVSVLVQTATAGLPANISLYKNGELYTDTDLMLDNGYNIIRFDLDTTQVGVFDYEVRVEAEGDISSFNNSYSFTQEITGDVHVLLVTTNPADVEMAETLYGPDAIIDSYVNDPNVPCTVEALA